MMRPNEVKLGVSDIVTAFRKKSIGSKVIWPEVFLANVKHAITAFDWGSCEQPGQAYIEMPTNMPNGVLPGDAPHSDDPGDYVCRFYRGRVRMFRKRHGVQEKVSHLAVVVYETEAYLNDPDVSQEEAEKIFTEGATHVLVAVLASSGPPSTLSPSAFIHNLAGGNNQAMSWSADRIREEAKKIEKYQHMGYTTVAD